MALSVRTQVEISVATNDSTSAARYLTTLLQHASTTMTTENKNNDLKNPILLITDKIVLQVHLKVGILLMAATM